MSDSDSPTVPASTQDKELDEPKEVSSDEPLPEFTADVDSRPPVKNVELFRDAAFDSEIRDIHGSLGRLEQRDSSPNLIPFPGTTAGWHQEHEALRGLLEAADLGVQLDPIESNSEYVPFHTQ